MKRTTNLLFPYSVRVHPSTDHLYVVDTYNHRVKKSQGGAFSQAAGGSDGTLLRSPTDLVLSESGELFITSPDHSQIMRKEKLSGFLKPLKVEAVDDVKNFTFKSPTQLDLVDGHLYVTDTLADKIIVINTTTLKGCSINVPRPLGIAVNRVTKEIHFTLRGSNKIHVWRSGESRALVGSSLIGFTDGTDTATFREPYGLAAGSAGEIFIADAGNHAVRVLDLEGRVTTLAGNRTKGRTDGPDATFNYPMGVCQGKDGSIYVADTYNHAVRKIFPNLEVETLL